MTAQPSGSRTRRWAWLALRLVGTVGGFAYVLLVADLGDVGRVLSDMPPESVAAAVLLVAANVAVASLRWRLLLRTYGADRLPSVTRLYRLYLVGLFYNTYFPGGIGGDVVRGVVSREAFGRDGVTAGLTVVLVERVLGMSGLLLLVAGALLLNPLPGMAGAASLGAAGIGGAVFAVLVAATARKVAPVLPSRLGRLASGVPPVSWPAGFGLALVLSLGTQLLVAASGYVLLVAVNPAVGPGDALVVVPAAAAAAFFPFTVGGAGAREAAFVFLCTAALQMDEADAVAASLMLWLAQMLVAAAGGMLQLASRRSEAEETP